LRAQDHRLCRRPACDQPAWLTAAYIPWGTFSFLEAVALPFGVPPASPALRCTGWCCFPKRPWPSWGPPGAHTRACGSSCSCSEPRSSRSSPARGQSCFNERLRSLASPYLSALLEFMLLAYNMVFYQRSTGPVRPQDGGLLGVSFRNTRGAWDLDLGGFYRMEPIRSIPGGSVSCSARRTIDRPSSR